MGKVAVIGAGAAGMFAAGFAAERGHVVTLIERNPKPGRKLMITGKGRCNVTNDCDFEGLLSNIPVNSRFLYSAFNRFGPRETMEFFERNGVRLKVERGNRVFPESDKASDIVDALRRFIENAGCRMVCARASGIRLSGNRVEGVELEDGTFLPADAVAVCTGGRSYPATGSTGDGYEMARRAGHSITPLEPSLVPLECVEQWPKDLQGLSLKNVTLEAVDKRTGKTLFQDIGEMLFTHFGVSGPLVLSASSRMRKMEQGRYALRIDLKPALTEEKLDARLQRDFIEFSNRYLLNSMHALLPAKLIPVFLKLSGVDPQLKCNQVTREMRHNFIKIFKRMELTVKNYRPIDEAIVTSGGVKVNEINPKTMESKLIGNLYFAGEILDVDGYTGGFNLQIAFSTGFAAGQSILSGR